MHECIENPVWPCAATGAASCLAGFEGLAVIMHGSSGCYYYPASLVHAPLFGTFITPEEVILGTGPRLREVVRDLEDTHPHIAVINTCVPSLAGEDLRACLEGTGAIIVDSPGFMGQFEEGYHTAIEKIRPMICCHGSGLNLDGLNPIDPFNAGNCREAERLLCRMGIGIAALISGGRFRDLKKVSSHTIGINADLPSNVGERIGSFLGIDEVRKSCKAIESFFDHVEIGAVLLEADAAEERIHYTADKYLRRHDPPRAAIFAGFSYGAFAAGVLSKYLDAEITCLCTRNKPSKTPYRVEQTISLHRIREVIAGCRPDLVIGSSFERSFSGEAAFIGLTPPLRGRVRISSRPIIGIEGELSFMEDVLNACLDRERCRTE